MSPRVEVFYRQAQGREPAVLSSLGFLASGGQRPSCVQWQVPAY